MTLERESFPLNWTSYLYYAIKYYIDKVRFFIPSLQGMWKVLFVEACTESVPVIQVTQAQVKVWKKRFFPNSYHHSQFFLKSMWSNWVFFYFLFVVIQGFFFLATKCLEEEDKKLYIFSMQLFSCVILFSILFYSFQGNQVGLKKIGGSKLLGARQCFLYGPNLEPIWGKCYTKHS